MNEFFLHRQVSDARPVRPELPGSFQVCLRRSAGNALDEALSQNTFLFPWFQESALCTNDQWKLTMRDRSKRNQVTFLTADV